MAARTLGPETDDDAETLVFEASILALHAQFDGVAEATGRDVIEVMRQFFEDVPGAQVGRDLGETVESPEEEPPFPEGAPAPAVISQEELIAERMAIVRRRDPNWARYGFTNDERMQWILAGIPPNQAPSRPSPATSGKRASSCSPQPCSECRSTPRARLHSTSFWRVTTPPTFSSAWRPSLASPSAQGRAPGCSSSYPVRIRYV
ncbi:hypothetical protein [Frondihabitans sucicola]|uniref:hypothetical protein n=1 Tax=Frondihabitans sucicola TaxID=1268041 RepID=UPI002572B477|nr:hypothetical protein [Frondihabitans sucicola]